jgi:hypothetical protein
MGKECRQMTRSLAETSSEFVLGVPAKPNTYACFRNLQLISTRRMQLLERESKKKV